MCPGEERIWPYAANFLLSQKPHFLRFYLGCLFPVGLIDWSAGYGELWVYQVQRHSLWLYPPTHEDRPMLESIKEFFERFVGRREEGVSDWWVNWTWKSVQVSYMIEHECREWYHKFNWVYSKSLNIVPTSRVQDRRDPQVSHCNNHKPKQTDILTQIYCWLIFSLRKKEDEATEFSPYNPVDRLKWRRTKHALCSLMTCQNQKWSM